MSDYKERARERFEEFKWNYNYEEWDEFRYEQKFLLEEELKTIPSDQTRRRLDIVKMLNDITCRIHQKPQKKTLYGEEKLCEMQLGDIIPTLVQPRKQLIESANEQRLNAIVFSFNRDKAEKKIKELISNMRETDIKLKIFAKDVIRVELYNGDKFEWMEPTPTARGYKPNKAYFDLNIRYSTFHGDEIAGCFTHLHNENIYFF